MDTREIIGRPIFGKGQKVAYTGTAGTITNALPDDVTAVQLVATTDCFFRIGSSPTAVADVDCYLPALTPMYFPARAGEKVSAVQVSAGGTLYVMPF
jgi:hypothetical protein